MMEKAEVLNRLQMWQDTLAQVRAFFAARGFVEIPYTPLLVTSPGMEPNLDPMEVDLHLLLPKRTIKAGLITSPEYAMKRLMGSGLEKIFTMTPVFRNEEADGMRHGPEFLMLEWYAKGGYEDLMNETEELLNSILGRSESWPRVPYVNVNMKDGEPQVSESHFFLTEYPAAEASLAKLAENGTAERFEAYANNLELCNGFCELTDPVEQRRRFELEAEERRVAGKTVFPIDEQFLEGLGAIEGSIYGNALGLDRLVMLKYGVADINSIQLFPFNERYRYGITK
jgi:lysyl-tRNA synthetase class 2